MTPARRYSNKGWKWRDKRRGRRYDHELERAITITRPWFTWIKIEAVAGADHLVKLYAWARRKGKKKKNNPHSTTRARSSSPSYCLSTATAIMATLQLKIPRRWSLGYREKMFNHLNDYLHPSSTKSALETAQALDALFPTHRSDEDQPEGEPRNHPRASSCIYGLLFLILQPRFVMTIRHKRSSLICWKLSRAWYRRRQLLVSMAMMLSSGETCRIYIGLYGKSLIVSPSLMLSPDDN